ncbi:PepSY domain-containing protein [Pseudoalteromonas mariniglutinosa]|uniref:PepSY domain-containing protein n=1 Tax=Pseudoalteromonas mariniglutinosa TaxID=206042 RepID=UPI00384BA4FB
MRVLLAFCFSLLLTVISYHAYSATDQKPQVSKKQAVALAEEAEDGKTLKITEQKNVYTVRILKTDGRVVDILVNKKTGKVKKD